jgi:MFS family permease
LVQVDDQPSEVASRRPGWLSAPVLGVAGISVASGFAQFAVTAVIGDVAADFGAPGAGLDPASQIGLTGTTLGVALATIRLASLGALPGTALADRLGRRRVLLATLVIGLIFTIASAGAPTFWIWVALVALARPWLSTVNGIAGVLGAEETSAKDRSAAVAVVGGAYGLGAGAVAVLRSVLPPGEWRLVIALSLLALAAVPWLSRQIREPAVFVEAKGPRSKLLGAVPLQHRRLVALLCAVTAGMGIATGPGFTYIFVFGERMVGATPEAMSAIILAAGPTGLLGLLAGRWGAEHLGRRPTAALAMSATAGAVALAYSGSYSALVAGYLLGITVSAAFGPPMGALVAEAFPTSLRSTATGWISAAGVIGAVTGLALYGVLVDVLGSFASAAILLSSPVILIAALLWWVPETRGQELHD